MASLKSMQKEDSRKGYKKLKDRTEAYYAGDLPLKDYKGFAGAYGSFAERNKRGNMVRLRNSTGSIDKDKLRFIVKEAEKNQVEMIHFATCQTIQFHHLNPDQVISLMEDAADEGFVTYGTGGDYPRNIMCSPLAGVDPDEIMNVIPCARAAAEYLVQILPDPKMPRKLKTAFSGDRLNLTHATYRDLGFTAGEDGTFDVYAAGGLGPNPAFGVKVAEGVQPEKVLYHVQAMINTFKKYGNPKNKIRARTRYMVEDLGGEDAFREAYREELKTVEQTMNLDANLEAFPAVTKKGDGTQPKDHWRITPQKQQGLYSVLYHPIGGCPDLVVLSQLLDTIKTMDDVELRSSPDQSVYIINLTGQEADKVLSVTESDSARSLFETSTACVGAETCVTGVRDSQKLLRDLTQAIRRAGISKEALPKIHISGCPSSCSAQQTAEIGLQGTVKVLDKVVKPAYFISLHGKNGRQDSRMGIQAGVILEENIVPFIQELGREVDESGLGYDEWSKQNPEGLDEIASRYTVQ